MVIEILGAVSLPVWLCVEELMHLRTKQPVRDVHVASATVTQPTGVEAIEARSAA
jgi:hypothetical protein